MGFKGVAANPASRSLLPGNNLKLSLRNTRFTLPSRSTVRQVMASPPTVTWGSAGSNPLSSGRQWPATANQGSLNSAEGADFSFTRSRNFNTPNGYYLQGGNVNYGGGSMLFNCMGALFIHTGSTFVIYVRGAAGINLLIKVDDQYVTLTPKTFPNDGSQYFGQVTFPGAGRRRIELIMTGGNGGAFGGVFTPVTDTIQPAAVRGPSVIFIGDSFTEGSNATAGAASSFPVVFGELMGYDDVINSGVGSTGYLATSGSRGTFRSRLATDVLPYAPDLVIFTGSVNDSAFTSNQIAAEAQLCFQYIRDNLPNTLIGCVSPFLKTGAAYAASFLLRSRPLLKTAVQSVGGIFVDLQQMPLPPHIAPQVTTLASGATAGATTLSTVAPLRPYSTYQFADSSECLCTNASGGGPYSATIDNLTNSQSAGTTITQVGSCLWTGNGNSVSLPNNGNCDVFVGADGTHPTQAGHEAIAEAIAYGFMNQLYSN